MPGTTRIGAHVDAADPLAVAAQIGADVVQFFLTDPQSWRAPVPRADAEALRGGGVDRYVHAPYLVNVASTNNKIRIPSRKILDQHAAAAAMIGARGLIVHGGHLGAGDDFAAGVENWHKTVERMSAPLPILVENTAGGDNAMARQLDALDRLWNAIGGSEQIGFCLDTCHAHAAGEALPDLVDRIMAITGRIDLVHANDSKDPFGSGRDRHENLGSGQIDPAVLVAVIARADAPVICETPGGTEGLRADIAFLRAAGI